MRYDITLLVAAYVAALKADPRKTFSSEAFALETACRLFLNAEPAVAPLKMVQQAADEAHTISQRFHEYRSERRSLVKAYRALDAKLRECLP